MSTGTVIDVRPHLSPDQHPAGARIEVARGEDLQVRYDRQLALVLRMSHWLNGPHAQAFPREAWDEHFSRYQTQLERLRRLGDELRPTTLRERQDLLTGETLTAEISELFAA